MTEAAAAPIRDQAAGAAGSVEVRDFGAVGDGIANDTRSLQAAVDHVAAAGGGRVVVSPGQYRVGTIHLRSDIDLHLAEGATLLVSDDRDDYHFVAFHPDKVPDVRWPILLCAEDAERVTISGSGRIVGDGRRFWGDGPVPGREYRWHAKLDTWRPHIIGMMNCRDVSIGGITISDPPVYGANLVNCEDVRIRDAHFEHDLTGPNTDGIHLTSCRRVVISDCTFVTGDDGVAFDGNGNGPAEDLVVTRCRFRSSTKMMRVFTGLAPWLTPEIDHHGTVRGVRVHDCVVEDAPSVVSVVAHRGSIEDVVVRDITATLTRPGVAVFIMSDEGSIRNVTVDRMTATCTGVLTASARKGDIIDGIRLERSTFDVSPAPRVYGLGYPDPIRGYPDYYRGAYNVYLRHVRRAGLDDVDIRWSAAIDGQTWPAVTAIDVDRLDLNGVRATPVGSPEEQPMLDLRDVRLARIEDCITDSGDAMTTAVAGVSAGSVRIDHEGAEFGHPTQRKDS